MRTIAFRSLALSALLLAGCGKGGDGVAPCGDGVALRFSITAVKDSLPLDSLDLRIALNGGEPGDFRVNLRTGRSSAAMEGRQGDAFTLTFALYSAGKRIGGGEAKGALRCDYSIDLDPVWDEAEVGKAKEILGRGSLLPPRLTEFFDQAIAGKVFLLPLESPEGILFRWSLKLGDSLVLDGEGARVGFTVPESLAGKEALLRVMAVSDSDDVLREERRWTLRVLAAPSTDRLARILIRTDSAASVGSSQAYRYQDGRLAVIEGFDALSPASGVEPAWAESLFYEGGRRVRAAMRLADGARLDSLFRYGEGGLLAAVEVRRAGETVVDSLLYESGRLSASRRYVSGTLQETAVYRWAGADSRTDSVFTPGKDGMELTRIIRNAYRGDSLTERLVLVGRGTPAPYRRESIAYNGLGQRAWREIWAEGSSSTLESSESHRYDAEGRRMALTMRDEVRGETLLDIRYLYEAAPAAKVSAGPAASGRSAAGQSAAGPSTAGESTALSRIASTALSSSALCDLAFAHDGWRMRPSAPTPGDFP